MGSGAVPSYHVSTPEQVSIIGSLPSTVYLSNQMQPVNYATYQSSAPANSLWIQGTGSWSQYASVPQGSTVPLIAMTSVPGNGYLTFTDASGQTYTYNYYFYPTSRLTFYADLPGRHILSFTVNGVTSNQIIIDVTGTYMPNNYLPPRYYPYYGYGYYPGFYGFGGSEIGDGEEGEGAEFGEGEGGEFGGEAGEVGESEVGEVGEAGESGETGERGGDRD